MEQVFIEIAQQGPVVGVLGYWVYTLKKDLQYARERADKKEDEDRKLYERFIEVVTKVNEKLGEP
jgi:hypothetical protein